MGLQILSPEYINWLHELTQLGYAKNLRIESAHKDRINILYTDGKTPEEALSEYIEFRKRLDEIK
ncbi:MAG: hypothetical protein JWO03_917 [Bacteroidetes bacterium]|nr:hypothetical protein [Bacteroidota bacterium]